MAVTYESSADKDERLAIRVTSKDKFAIELLARKQGKTISGIAKEALERMLKEPETGLMRVDGRNKTYLPDICWDPLASDRFVKLAMHAPELLSNNEHLMWKVISEDTTYLEKNGEPKLKLIRENLTKINKKAVKLFQDQSN